MLQYGDTPLHTAARYGHAGVTRILVSAKCAVSETNKVCAACHGGVVIRAQTRDHQYNCRGPSCPEITEISKVS